MCPNFNIGRTPTANERLSDRPRTTRAARRTALTILAVQEVAHCSFARGVEFAVGLAFVAGSVGRRYGFILSTAIRTPVREAPLAGFQLELLSTNGTGFDGKGHAEMIIEGKSPFQQAHFFLLTTTIMEVFGFAGGLAPAFAGSSSAVGK